MCPVLWCPFTVNRARQRLSHFWAHFVRIQTTRTFKCFISTIFFFSSVHNSFHIFRARQQLLIIFFLWLYTLVRAPLRTAPVECIFLRILLCTNSRILCEYLYSYTNIQSLHTHTFTKYFSLLRSKCFLTARRRRCRAAHNTAAGWCGTPIWTTPQWAFLLF